MILPPGRLPASHTSTDRPLRASHQAEASPEMPPPLMSTSTLSIAILLILLELCLHFLKQILTQQISGMFPCRNKVFNGIKTLVGFGIFLEARHAVARDRV